MQLMLAIHKYMIHKFSQDSKETCSLFFVFVIKTVYQIKRGLDGIMFLKINIIFNTHMLY